MNMMMIIAWVCFMFAMFLLIAIMLVKDQFKLAIKMKFARKFGWIILEKIFKDGSIKREICKYPKEISENKEDPIAQKVLQHVHYDRDYKIPIIYSVEGQYFTSDLIDEMTSNERVNELLEANPNLKKTLEDIKNKQGKSFVEFYKEINMNKKFIPKFQEDAITSFVSQAFRSGVALGRMNNTFLGMDSKKSFFTGMIIALVVCGVLGVLYYVNQNNSLLSGIASSVKGASVSAAPQTLS